MRAAHWQLNPRIREYLLSNPEARRTLQRMAQTGSNVEEVAAAGSRGRVVFERLQPQHPGVSSGEHPLRSES